MGYYKNKTYNAYQPKEETQKQDKEPVAKNYMPTEIRLSRIKIGKEYKLPSEYKFAQKYSYLKKFHIFEQPIYLDRHNELIDGYTTYLLARMFGIKKMIVWKETLFMKEKEYNKSILLQDK